MFSSNVAKMNETRAVIFLLKFLEFVLCTLCMGLHILGILNEDTSFTHDVYCCGIFITFTFHSVIGCIAIYTGIALPLLLEIIVNAMASLLFIVASIVPMVKVQNDPLLVQLDDQDELHHPYFIISRGQSFFSLQTAILFAMHALLLLDLLHINESKLDEDNAANQPLQLKFFPYRFCLWLQKVAPNSYTSKMLQKMESVFEIHSGQWINRTI